MVAPALWPCETWEVSVGLSWPNTSSQGYPQGFALLRVVLQPQPSGAYTATVMIPPFQCQHPQSDPVCPGNNPTGLVGYPTGQATPFVQGVTATGAPWPYGTMWLGINVHWKNGYLACGLQLAAFYSSRNGVLASSGIQYPVVYRQDYPAVLIDNPYTGQFHYGQWPGTWTGYGWNLWAGDAAAPAAWRIFDASISLSAPVCANPTGNYDGAVLFASMNPYAWLSGPTPPNDDLLWLARIYPSPNPWPVWDPNAGRYDYYDVTGTWQAEAGAPVPQLMPSWFTPTAAQNFQPETFNPATFPGLYPPTYAPWASQGAALILANGNQVPYQSVYTGQAFATSSTTTVSYQNQGVPLATGGPFGAGVFLDYLGARWLTPGMFP